MNGSLLINLVLGLVEFDPIKEGLGDVPVVDVAEPLVGQLHHPHISLEEEDVEVAEHPVARALPSQLQDERLANFLQDKGGVVVLCGFDLGGEIVQEEFLAFENALKEG